MVVDFRKLVIKVCLIVPSLVKIGPVVIEENSFQNDIFYPWLIS